MAQIENKHHKPIITLIINKQCIHLIIKLIDQVDILERNASTEDSETKDASLRFM